ncbi:MAG: HEAT repeat domain-containing protein, partial [Halothece sp.]
MGDARAVPSLIQLLQEEALTVRFSAVIALGQLKAREGVSDLIERLQDPEKEVQLLAAWALGEIGDPVAIEPLSQLA